MIRAIVGHAVEVRQQVGYKARPITMQPLGCVSLSLCFAVTARSPQASG